MFLVPARFIFRGCLSFLLFVISNVCTNKNQQALRSSSPQLSTKKTLNKEMVFVCVLIRTRAKILKPWYARSVVDRSITLHDLFCKFASGEFDDGGKNTDIRTTQVRKANSFIL